VWLCASVCHIAVVGTCWRQHTKNQKQHANSQKYEMASTGTQQEWEALLHQSSLLWFLWRQQYQQRIHELQPLSSTIII